METETITLPGTTPGARFELVALHFGTRGGEPKAYVQAGLHANEAPGLLVAHHLRQRLATLEREGRISGEIILVPAANPLGFAQHVQGSHHGRFSLADGVNFNRAYPCLTQGAAHRVTGQLTHDPKHNGRLIAAALRDTLAQVEAIRPAEHLKAALLARAIDAETVLDLHCDSEAVMHLYTLTPHADAVLPLASWLGARALLLADVSGEDPFDEAVSRPWAEIAALYPEHPVPEAGVAVTVELRGEADVDHVTAAADAEALLHYLALRGHLEMTLPEISPAPCAPTPLEGAETVSAPVSGIIVFHRDVGDDVVAGQMVAEIIDPITGVTTAVAAHTSGILFARASERFALAGKRLAKIAGTTPFRTGKLLSP